MRLERCQISPSSGHKSGRHHPEGRWRSGPRPPLPSRAPQQCPGREHPLGRSGRFTHRPICHPPGAPTQTQKNNPHFSLPRRFCTCTRLHLSAPQRPDSPWLLRNPPPWPSALPRPSGPRPHSLTATPGGRAPPARPQPPARPGPPGGGGRAPEGPEASSPRFGAGGGGGPAGAVSRRDGPGRHVSGTGGFPRLPAGPSAGRAPQSAAGRAAPGRRNPARPGDRPGLQGSPPPSPPAGAGVCRSGPRRALPSAVSGKGRGEERRGRDPAGRPPPPPRHRRPPPARSRSPEILVHGLEEELVAVDGPVAEDIFEIGQSDFFRRDGQLHQIGGLLLVYVVDDFSLRHGRGAGRRGGAGPGLRRRSAPLTASGPEPPPTGRELPAPGRRRAGAPRPGFRSLHCSLAARPGNGSPPRLHPPARRPSFPPPSPRLRRSRQRGRRGPPLPGAGGQRGAGGGVRGGGRAAGARGGRDSRPPPPAAAAALPAELPQGAPWRRGGTTAGGERGGFGQPRGAGPIPHPEGPSLQRDHPSSSRGIIPRHHASRGIG